jgi:hypothetical protein
MQLWSVGTLCYHNLTYQHNNRIVYEIYKYEYLLNDLQIFMMSTLFTVLMVGFVVIILNWMQDNFLFKMSGQ